MPIRAHFYLRDHNITEYGACQVEDLENVNRSGRINMQATHQFWLRPKERL